MKQHAEWMIYEKWIAHFQPMFRMLRDESELDIHTAFFFLTLSLPLSAPEALFCNIFSTRHCEQQHNNKNKKNCVFEYMPAFDVRRYTLIWIHKGSQPTKKVLWMPFLPWRMESETMTCRLFYYWEIKKTKQQQRHNITNHNVRRVHCTIQCAHKWWLIADLISDWANKKPRLKYIYLCLYS